MSNVSRAPRQIYRIPRNGQDPGADREPAEQIESQLNQSVVSPGYGTGRESRERDRRNGHGEGTERYRKYGRFGKSPPTVEEEEEKSKQA